ncbi:MAG: GNAT family protein [Pseudomonadota bacterium]
MVARLLDWLGRSIAPENTAILRSGDLILRSPRPCDHGQWVQLRMASQLFLQPYEPLWPEDDLKPAAWTRRLKRYRRDASLKLGYVWLIWRQTGGEEELVGGVSLTGVRYGVMQAGTLGYWIGQPFARQAIATRAVQAVIDHAHANLRLSRIEAATLPDNEASMGLLRKLGFEQEGLAVDYLRINGRWRDHALFARTRRNGGH